MHCLQSTHAYPQARLLMCASSSPKPEMARTAFADAEPCRTKAGAIARHGVCCSKEPVLPRQRPLVPGTGRTAGSTTHRGPLPYTIAIACFCLPCRPVRAHCSTPRQGRMPERGSPLCRATRQPATSDANCVEATPSPALACCPSRCGPSPGCGGAMDPLGDHALACSRVGQTCEGG